MFSPYWRALEAARGGACEQRDADLTAPRDQRENHQRHAEYYGKNDQKKRLLLHGAPFPRASLVWFFEHAESSGLVSALAQV